MNRISTIFDVSYMNKLREVEETDKKHYRKLTLSKDVKYNHQFIEDRGKLTRK